MSRHLSQDLTASLLRQLSTDRPPVDVGALLAESPKDLAKVIGVGQATVLGNVLEAEACRGEQALGPLHPHLGHEARRGAGAFGALRGRSRRRRWAPLSAARRRS